MRVRWNRISTGCSVDFESGFAGWVAGIRVFDVRQGEMSRERMVIIQVRIRAKTEVPEAPWSPTPAGMLVFGANLPARGRALRARTVSIGQVSVFSFFALERMACWFFRV